MPINGLCKLAARELGNRTYKSGPKMLLDGRVLLMRSSSPTPIEGTIYKPLFCLVLQGEKVVRHGSSSVACPAGSGIIVSHDLPVVSQITAASPGAPYMALIIMLDLSKIRALCAKSGTLPSEEPGHILAAQPVDDGLIDAASRVLELGRSGDAAKLIAPAILDEIHARVLLAPHGAMLRRLMNSDDPASRIEKAIEIIRRSMTGPISVAELAAVSGMSKSSFHTHFKSITGLSPLHYHKQLKLVQARSDVLFSAKAISAIAYAVGYESASQFSREYSRQFGMSPRNDRARAKQADAEVGE